MAWIYFHSILILTAITSLIVSLFPSQMVVPGYHILWIHPLLFLVVYIVIFIPLINIGQYKVTLYSFIILSWIRLVLIPLGSVLSGVYNGVQYIYVGSDTVQSAILLVAFELIATSIFLALLIIMNKSKENKISFDNLSRSIVLKGNKYIYGLFIIVALGLYFFIGRNMNIINFFVIPVGTEQRYGDLDSTLLVLLRQIIITSLIFLFVWFVSFCKKRYESSGKLIYVNLAILVGVLNIGVIIGERRAAQLYTALVVMFILIFVFKKHKKWILSVISISGVSVILLMSIYKHFAAFAHDSYSDAISSSSFDLGFITTTLQMYFFGTQNVAAVLELNKYHELNIINMLYDFGRSTFGISFILKDQMTLTSELFNNFVYGQPIATGHLISGIAYGYIYLGVLLAPLIVCLNIFISISIEKWFNKTTSFEMKYILGFILVRFATNIFTSTPPLVNWSTMMLFTAGLLYFVANYLRRGSMNH